MFGTWSIFEAGRVLHITSTTGETVLTLPNTRRDLDVAQQMITWRNDAARTAGLIDAGLTAAPGWLDCQGDLWQHGRVIEAA